MSDQDEHDLRMSKASLLMLATKAQLEDSLLRKNGASMEPPSSATTGPVAAAMRDNPGLTSDQALKQMQSLGW